MAWPIIASTATTLSVYVPLLFWAGVTGEFMKYLPITVILTLAASLLMALVFVPVVGGVLGRRRPQSARAKAILHAAEIGDPRRLPGLTGIYARFLEKAVTRPWTTLLLTVALLFGAFAGYSDFGHGVVFFPDIEPEVARVEIRSRDNFSIYERDDLVRRVEARLLGQPEIKSVYAQAMLSSRSDAELVGLLQLELVDWDERRPAAQIMTEIREGMSDIAGNDVQVQVQSFGPAPGKPVQLEIRADNEMTRIVSVEAARAMMTQIGGFTDVTDATIFLALFGQQAFGIA